jgi:hypothetical protein
LVILAITTTAKQIYSHYELVNLFRPDFMRNPDNKHTHAKGHTHTADAQATYTNGGYSYYPHAFCILCSM